MNLLSLMLLPVLEHEFISYGWRSPEAFARTKVEVVMRYKIRKKQQNVRLSFENHP